MAVDGIPDGSFRFIPDGAAKAAAGVDEILAHSVLLQRAEVGYSQGKSRERKPLARRSLLARLTSSAGRQGFEQQG
jgi:hypothetical protein